MHKDIWEAAKVVATKPTKEEAFYALQKALPPGVAVTQDFWTASAVFVYKGYEWSIPLAALPSLPPSQILAWMKEVDYKEFKQYTLKELLAPDLKKVYVETKPSMLKSLAKGDGFEMFEKKVVGSHHTAQLVDDLVGEQVSHASDALKCAIDNFKKSLDPWTAKAILKHTNHVAEDKGGNVSDQFKAITGAAEEYIDAVAPKKKKKKVGGVAKATKPPIHCLVYGDAGSKKSTFAATFPKPMLVFMFDPFGKDQPYLRKGSIVTPPLELGEGHKIRSVMNEEGDALIRLEYFHDLEPTKPVAWRAFMERMKTATDFGDYKTVVFDSVTFMQLTRFHEAKYKLLKSAKDPRQWYASAKEGLEEMLMVRVAGMYQNVVILAHVNEDKDEVHGGFVYNPAVPGKLSKGLPAGYAEFYRAYVKTEEGVNHFYLQTEKSTQFNAASQIPAPNPCVPTYKALWEN